MNFGGESRVAPFTANCLWHFGLNLRLHGIQDFATCINIGSKASHSNRGNMNSGATSCTILVNEKLGCCRIRAYRHISEIQIISQSATRCRREEPTYVKNITTANLEVCDCVNATAAQVISEYLERIRTRTAGQHIITAATMQYIIANTTMQYIIASTTSQGVEPSASK